MCSSVEQTKERKSPLLLSNKPLLVGRTRSAELIQTGVARFRDGLRRVKTTATNIGLNNDTIHKRTLPPTRSSETDKTLAEASKAVLTDLAPEMARISLMRSSISQFDADDLHLIDDASQHNHRALEPLKEENEEIEETFEEDSFQASDESSPRSQNHGRRRSSLLATTIATAVISSAVGSNRSDGIKSFGSFAAAQYKQNVGGRVIPRDEYIRHNIANDEDISSLLSLTTDYELTSKHMKDYAKNGFVVLKNFLNASDVQILENIGEYHLDQLAFPDLLTSCSRKFHGEHYHSVVSWQFWQQPRISNMLSTLALDGETPYAITSEILEMRDDLPNTSTGGSNACIPHWHWDFLTFPMNYHESYKSGTQIWMAGTETVNAETGGGLAFMPGSHLWANNVDEGAKKHPCFAMNLFEDMTSECNDLLESSMVAPELNAGDIVVFSRFTLHRSVVRKAEYPFKSGRRLGYTLRVGSGASTFKKDTLTCFPSHPTTHFQGQLEEGRRYDSAHHNEAIYRPMDQMDSDEFILDANRKMSLPTFLMYSAESTYRQKVSYKLLDGVEHALNGAVGSKTFDLKCVARPTNDV